MRTILIFLLNGYRWFISPLLGSNCRFYPTCSQYAHAAVTRHGAWHGAHLALRRVLKCHPWHPGGYDPVPDEWPTRSAKNL